MKQKPSKAFKIWIILLWILNYNYAIKSTIYHINGAFSLKIRTPHFDHSLPEIHNSGALSKHDITAAPIEKNDKYEF